MGEIDKTLEDNSGGGTPGYDPKLLGELAREIIGRQSLTAYSVMSGLSLSYLSKLTNAKLISPPSKRTLIRLANPMVGKPEGNVSIYKLFRAAGYSGEDCVEASKIERHPRSVPKISETVAFPLFLILNHLLEDGSLGASLEISIRHGLYEISGNGKRIIALPAYGSKEIDTKSKIKNVGRALIGAYGILGDIQEVSILILTDNADVYDFFEEYIKIPPDVIVKIALTEDYLQYNKFRTVKPYVS